MKLRYAVAVLALCLGVNAPAAAAATLKGTARNGTTGKPAAGDVVILMSLAGTATEIGRGKTDASGRFRFSVAGTQAPHLVRAVHQSVAYQVLVPAGVNSVEVKVYDVVRKLDGVTATLAVQRLQTAGDTLQVIEEIALRNASDPPRTLVNDRPFEIQLPPEAQVISGRVQTGGGQPVTRKPTPGDQNGRYYFPFPLLPGDSRFSVAYLLPYRGEAAFEPKILYPLENYIVVLPRSMKFEAKAPGMFQPMPGKTGSNVQEMAAVKPGEPLAFRVSGTGRLAEPQGGQQRSQGRQTAPPGDHVGAPAELPDAPHNLRWSLLGGLAVVLAAAIAGFLKHKRKQRRHLSPSGGRAQEWTSASGRVMGRRRSNLASKLMVIGVALPVLLYSYSTGPPAGKTGAPGEGTCRDCHGGGSGGGKVEISFPGGMVYTPGVKQQLTVTITDPDANWYGFELSARLATDNSRAGTLAPAAGESNIRVICSDDRPRGASGCPPGAPIEYIEHSPARRTNTFRIEWTPPATEQGPVRIYVAANAANGNGDPTFDDIYTANYTLTPQAGQPANQPKFTAAGVVNGASFAAGMAPGAFISIFGESLAPLTRSWDGAIQGTTLPSQLEGVSVTVGGKPSYLALVSPLQLNVLLPTDDMAGSVEVKVTTPQGSASVAAASGRYAPGFFLLDRKYVVATHADNALVARVGEVAGVTSRAAQPGEEIVLWGTGFGPTAEQVPSGQMVTKAYPLASLTDLKVTLGARDARVTFAGVTIAGVYQINAVVPADLADGDHVVQAQIGGTRTQDNAFLVVQRPAQSASILVSYRLDPWLVSNNYLGGLWVSPPVLGPTTQGGNTFTLETRAAGLDAQGQVTNIIPEWIPSDPEMVTVSPGQGPEVKITVHRAGQSSLKVTAQGVSKELVIKATYQGGALVVEIDQ